MRSNQHLTFHSHVAAVWALSEFFFGGLRNPTSDVFVVPFIGPFVRKIHRLCRHPWCTIPHSDYPLSRPWLTLQIKHDARAEITTFRNYGTVTDPQQWPGTDLPVCVAWMGALINHCPVLSPLRDGLRKVGSVHVRIPGARFLFQHPLLCINARRTQVRSLPLRLSSIRKSLLSRLPIRRRSWQQVIRLYN